MLPLILMAVTYLAGAMAASFVGAALADMMRRK